MALVANVYAVLNLSVDRGHDITDLETDPANLDEVFLLQAVAWHFHVRAAIVTHHSPDLLLWLLFEYLVNVLVDVGLVEDPVGAVLLQ